MQCNFACVVLEGAEGVGVGSRGMWRICHSFTRIFLTLQWHRACNERNAPQAILVQTVLVDIRQKVCQPAKNEIFFSKRSFVCHCSRATQKVSWLRKIRHPTKWHHSQQTKTHKLTSCLSMSAFGQWSLFAWLPFGKGVSVWATVVSGSIRPLRYPPPPFSAVHAAGKNLAGQIPMWQWPVSFLPHNPLERGGSTQNVTLFVVSKRGELQWVFHWAMGLECVWKVSDFSVVKTFGAFLPMFWLVRNMYEGKHWSSLETFNNTHLFFFWPRKPFVSDPHVCFWSSRVWMLMLCVIWCFDIKRGTWLQKGTSSTVGPMPSFRCESPNSSAVWAPPPHLHTQFNFRRRRSWSAWCSTLYEIAQQSSLELDQKTTGRPFLTGTGVSICPKAILFFSHLCANLDENLVVGNGERNTLYFWWILHWIII